MTDRQTDRQTGYPSVDKLWLKYYSSNVALDLNPECSLWEFLYECNKDHLAYTALNYFGNRITYGELFIQIDAVASALQAIGVKTGDIVSVCPLNTPEFVYLLYAINKIGAVSNWLGITSPVQDLKEQVLSTNSKYLFVVESAYDMVMEAVKGTRIERIIVVPLSDSMPGWMKIAYGLKNRKMAMNNSWNAFLSPSGGKKEIPSLSRGDNLAMIQYTGGSTGVPKGVMLTNKNLNAYYLSFERANGCGISNFQKGDRYLACVPLFLAFGASASCHGPLCHTLELVLAPDPSPRTLGRLILKRKPQHIVAGRVQIDGFLREATKARKDLSYIRSIMYGGEAANRSWEQNMAKTLQKFRMEAPILNGYGMTECSSCILVATKDNRDGLIPLGNVDVKIIDPDSPHIERGYDTEGELCLSADTVMRGYYRKDAETEEVVFEEEGVHWLRTRDLATISKDGRIHLTGRIKRIYHKLNSEKVGTRVYPMRIEEVIIAGGGVEACAVVGVIDEKTAYRTIAFVVLVDGVEDRNQAIDRIDRLCRKNLPDSHIPDEYRFVDSFPLTRGGKVDYRELEKTAAKEGKE